MYILIVENEPLVVIDIQEKLGHCGYSNCASTDNVDDALKSIELKKPDLVFVDIELNGDKNGIDLGQQLNKKGIPFIYLSQLQDMRTFELAKLTNPVTNIPKPVMTLQLRNCLLEMEDKKTAQKDQNKAFIVVADKGKKIPIQKEAILFLKAARNNCDIHILDKRYVSATPLNNVLENINEPNFVQIHRSYAVNVTKIKHLEGNMIYLNGVDEPLSLGDKYRTDFMKIFDPI